MRKKKHNNQAVCPRCGNSIDPDTMLCTVCAEPVIVPGNGREEKSENFLGVFAMTLSGLMLAVSVVLMMILLFFHALHEKTSLPALGIISSQGMAIIFDAWYPFALGGGLILIWTLVIAMINVQRFRTFFRVVGVSVLAGAAGSASIGLLVNRLFRLMSGAWQDVMVNAAGVFREFALVYAVILVMVGSLFLLIHGCIAAVKGGSHEART